MFYFSGFKENMKRYLYNWVCGTVERPQQKLTKQQSEFLRRKLTSLYQDPTKSKALNICAVLVAFITVFLIGFYI